MEPRGGGRGGHEPDHRAPGARRTGLRLDDHEARRGIIFALDAETGERLWSFTTLEDPSSLPADRAAGGAWYTPLVDRDGGVYFGIGNAYITAREGLEDPDPMLYTNSVVKLDPETGELLWHYQAVPNDFYDWDMQVSPVHVDDAEQPMVLGAGKMGYVYAMSPDGGLIWKRSVGLHNGHDDDPVRALEDPGSVTIDPPVEIAPGPYGGVETNMAYQDGVAYAAIVNLAPRRSPTTSSSRRPSTGRCTRCRATTARSSGRTTSRARPTRPSPSPATP